MNGNDFKQSVAALSQSAKGSITFGVPVAADMILINGSGFQYDETPGENQYSTIAELTTLINNLADVNATDDGEVITVVASAPGAAGNALTLALGESNAGTMEISGDTLTGGVDATYTDKIDLGGEFSGVDTVISISALTGTTPSATITPQTSLDGVVWVDRTPTAALNATGSTELGITNPLRYLRFKIVLGGTVDPTLSAAIVGAPNEE